MALTRYEKSDGMSGGIKKSDFPKGFLFGAASSAYQVEGAATEAGKGPSIWDTFCKVPGKIIDGSSGDVSVDHYHRYEEDIDLLRSLGFNSYRFSISWARILPDGISVNPEGLAHYNSVIDALLKKGIEPFVTLYHWDLPQALEDLIGGWRSPEIVNYFVAFSETCFNAFGDRVKNWVTINEPYMMSLFCYDIGIHAPGRCSNRNISSAGDSTMEPYIVAHNSLLAHAASVNVYKTEFKESQHGQIGIVVHCTWSEPLSHLPEDQEAAKRSLDFDLGWFLDPIFFGEYPSSMRELVRDRLPNFSSKEKELLLGSYDFIGVNYYTTRYVSALSHTNYVDNLFDSNLSNDLSVKKHFGDNGSFIGEKGASEWMFIVPWGLKKLLNWISTRYNNPPTYITENGMDEEDDPTKALGENLCDTKRVRFYQDHLHEVLEALREGADVRGYFAWSLLDSFEWTVAYRQRFGLVFVDYKDNLKRYPKSSALWFEKFLKSRNLA